MNYKNPVLMCDVQDGSILKRGNYFYMVGASFHLMPALPIFKSKNLKDWKCIGHVIDALPFAKFLNVNRRDGIFTPSLYYRKGIYYVLFSSPQSGIFVCSCMNIEKGNWTKPRCLLAEPGLISPAVVWHHRHCYLAFTWIKEVRADDSVVWVYEVTPDLETTIGTQMCFYDGHLLAPHLSSLQWIQKDEYVYLLVTCGQKPATFQLCLRSKDLFGPVDAKIVMMDGTDAFSGPFCARLLEYKKGYWASFHLQNQIGYGNSLWIGTVRWQSDWPILGKTEDDLYGIAEHHGHLLELDDGSHYKLKMSDFFSSKQKNLLWQTPACVPKDQFLFQDGLQMRCMYHSMEAMAALHRLPSVLLMPLLYPSFKVSALSSLALENENDEAGICFMGNPYRYLCVVRKNKKNHLQLKEGYFNQSYDVVLWDCVYQNKELEWMFRLQKNGFYQFGFNRIYLNFKHRISSNDLYGGRIGLYIRGMTGGGSVQWKFFKVRELKR